MNYVISLIFIPWDRTKRNMSHLPFTDDNHQRLNLAVVILKLVEFQTNCMSNIVYNTIYALDLPFTDSNI